MSSNVSKIFLEDNQFITYEHYKTSSANKPGVIFLHGFRSDMLGDKAKAIKQFCLQMDIDYLAFDCLNHGFSSGDRNGGSISIWRSNFVTVLDKLVDKPYIFVGSSMGGWLALLGAIDRPNLCHSIVGIAAAPDFTEDMLNELTDKQKLDLKNNGSFLLDSEWAENDYYITKSFLEDAKQNLVKYNEKINIDKPIRLLHGLLDKDVSYQISMKIAKNVISSNVQTIFIKDGDHRLSRPADLTLLIQAIVNLI